MDRARARCSEPRGLGFYSVDNLPVELIPKFAELTLDNPSIRAAALVVDIREGEGLKRFPKVFSTIRESVNARLIFLEADNEAIVRRFSETRRPHPLGTNKSITRSIISERAQLAPIRAMADLTINTSKFTVHELREFIGERFGSQRDESKIMIYVTSFGYRNGVPPDSDLVFDVPISAQSKLHSAVQEPDRPASQCGPLHSVFSSNCGICAAYFGFIDLLVAALYSGGKELSYDSIRVHWRAAPLGNDG